MYLLFFVFHRKKGLRKSQKMLFYLKSSFCYQDIQVFAKFHFLIKHFKISKSKVENRIIVISWNGLHKLSIVIFWIDKNLNGLKHRNRLKLNRGVEIVSSALFIKVSSLTKLQHQTFFTSQDIKQFVCLNSFSDTWWYYRL